jgi:DNA-directed RNA polymerase I, II, and III subunit RPABC2
MSSYFDNQYGGEDEDNKFHSNSSDEESETSSVASEIEETGVDELEGVVEEDIDDELIDDNEEDSDDEELDLDGGALEELEEGENDEENEKKNKRTKKIPAKTVYKQTDYDEENDEDDDDNDGELYLQKFDQSINDNYIVNFHPECALQNYDEILSMVKVIRDKNGIIIDDLHRTIPYLTKYERARILGQRAKQINSGAPTFIKVPENVIDGYIMAELELKEKKIPFIVRRPLPNGGSEYWSIKDLEDISF